MKKAILTALILIPLFSGVLKAQTTKPDTNKYHFSEQDAILIDNLMSQLDQVSGNSDKVSTAQYNQLHKAVMHIDSLIKVQYLKKHPVKEQSKKGENKQ